MARHEQVGAEVYGLGVGLDLSPYYSRSQALDLSGSMNMAVFRDIFAKIGRSTRR